MKSAILSSPKQMFFTEEEEEDDDCERKVKGGKWYEILLCQ